MRSRVIAGTGDAEVPTGATGDVVGRLVAMYPRFAAYQQRAAAQIPVVRLTPSSARPH